MRIKLATPLIGEFPRYTDKGWFSLDNRFATHVQGGYYDEWKAVKEVL